MRRWGRGGRVTSCYPERVKSLITLTLIFTVIMSTRHVKFSSSSQQRKWEIVEGENLEESNEERGTRRGSSGWAHREGRGRAPRTVSPVDLHGENEMFKM